MTDGPSFEWPTSTPWPLARWRLLFMTPAVWIMGFGVAFLVSAARTS